MQSQDNVPTKDLFDSLPAELRIHIYEYHISSQQWVLRPHRTRGSRGIHAKGAVPRKMHNKLFTPNKKLHHEYMQVFYAYATWTSVVDLRMLPAAENNTWTSLRMMSPQLRTRLRNIEITLVGTALPTLWALTSLAHLFTSEYALMRTERCEAIKKSLKDRPNAVAEGANMDFGLDIKFVGDGDTVALASAVRRFGDMAAVEEIKDVSELQKALFNWVKSKVDDPLVESRELRSMYSYWSWEYYMHQVTCEWITNAEDNLGRV